MKIYIKGNYNNFLTKLEASRLKENNNKIFINIHGLYSQSGDKGSKSSLLGKRLIISQIAHVVQYSSSRDWNTFDDSDKEKSKKSFLNKTFDQERQDLVDVIDLLTNNSRELFDINPESVSFYVVANSLGGTITSSLSEKFDQIEKIVLCGSGTGASSPNKPILSTYPSKEFITASASKYKGELLFLQGSLDDVVPIFSQKELYDSFKSVKNKEYKIIEGANHNFSSINGRDKKLAYRAYINEIVSFLKS